MTVAEAVERADAAAWMGDIPDHWDVARLKYVAKLGTGHTPSRQVREYWEPEECTIPWVTLADVWQLRDGGRTTTITDTAEMISETGLAHSAAVLHPKGTVILSRTASVGFSAILGVDAATSQDFMTWTCGPQLEPMYLLYVLRAMKQEFRRLVMGSTHKTIYMPDIERLTIPLPPIDEQRTIAATLATRVEPLDATVAAKKKLRVLLDERRYALVAQAVTAGAPRLLAARTRTSVPVGWQLSRLKWCVQKLTSGGTPDVGNPDYWTMTDDGCPWVAIGDMSAAAVVIETQRRVTDEGLAAVRLRPAPAGTLLFSMYASLGHVAKLGVPAVWNQAILGITPNPAVVDPNFLWWWLQFLRPHLKALARSTTQDNLNAEQVGNLPVLVPPLEIQRRVAADLDHAAERLARLDARLNDQMARVAEHRETLIFDAVTGRLQEE